MACVEQRPLPHATTSLDVLVTAPADLGSEATRISGIKQASLQVTAVDELGQVDSSFSAELDVYAHFLGSLTPERGVGTPAHIAVTSGMGTGLVDLPLAYGETYLWLEDARRQGATFATGVSPTLWYREPFLVDISRPADETKMPEALTHSPLEGKQVRIAGSEYGAAGHVVVTAVYAQGFTVSDVDCTTRPCRAKPYAHVFVFSFGSPKDGPYKIEMGQTLSAVSGGVGEFNGFTELNFPQALLARVDASNPDSAPAAADEELLPAPVEIDKKWLAKGAELDDMINLERVESGLVSASSAKVCPLDGDFTKYSQWKLDIGNGCGQALNVITEGVVSSFDPKAQIGKTIPRVVGTLRAVNTGTFNVWIVYPRRLSDLTLE